MSKIVHHFFVGSSFANRPCAWYHSASLDAWLVLSSSSWLSGSISTCPSTNLRGNFSAGAFRNTTVSWRRPDVSSFLGNEGNATVSTVLPQPPEPRSLSRVAV